MNEQETSNNERVTEAQTPQPTEENVENTSNNEKYVLYADIMGFKERVMRNKAHRSKERARGAKGRVIRLASSISRECRDIQSFLLLRFYSYC